MAISRVPLDKEELDDVSGGYIHWDRRQNCYQAINDYTGDVIRDNCTYYDAVTCALQYGMSNKEIDNEQLQKLRETGSL